MDCLITLCTRAHGIAEKIGEIRNAMFVAFDTAPLYIVWDVFYVDLRARLYRECVVGNSDDGGIDATGEREIPEIESQVWAAGGSVRVV